MKVETASMKGNQREREPIKCHPRQSLSNSLPMSQNSINGRESKERATNKMPSETNSKNNSLAMRIRAAPMEESQKGRKQSINAIQDKYLQ